MDARPAHRCDRRCGTVPDFHSEPGNRPGPGGRLSRAGQCTDDAMRMAATDSDIMIQVRISRAGPAPGARLREEPVHVPENPSPDSGPLLLAPVQGPGRPSLSRRTALPSCQTKGSVFKYSNWNRQGRPRPEPCSGHAPRRRARTATSSTSAITLSCRRTKRRVSAIQTL